MVTPGRIDRLAQSLLVELLLDAQEKYWLKRAQDFAKVGTPQCDEIAKACRAKASLCREESADEWTELLAVELGDVA